MRRLIVPTSDLVREFWHCEPLLCFYDEGVRGLIRDTVLLNCGVPAGSFSLHRRRKEPPLFSDGLLDHVLGEFERSLEVRFLENTLPQRAESASFAVEAVVEAIDEAVARMMREFLLRDIYEICKTRWQWIGYDLLVMVQVLDRG